MASPEAETRAPPLAAGPRPDGERHAASCGRTPRPPWARRPTWRGSTARWISCTATSATGGLGASVPYVPTWLGDIRRYFPREVVAFMEKDAIERRGLKQLLLEPETLQTLEKDVSLVATMLAFKDLMPEQTRQTARQVVAEIVEDLRRRLETELRQAVLGALRRDRHSPLQVARNLDFRRTVRDGLRHYQPELGKIIPERVHFFANQRATTSGGSSFWWTRAGRWASRWSTRRSSRRCSPRCPRSTRGWCSSTRASPT